jgi:DNA-binding MarR family transcriptional regulator
MTQHELASLIRLDKSVFTSTVDSLERKGLVRRRTDQRDRRARRPELTPAGRGLSEQSSRAVEELQTDLLATLPAQTAGELIQTLHAFVFGPFADAVSFGSQPPRQRDVVDQTDDADQ